MARQLRTDEGRRNPPRPHLPQRDLAVQDLGDSKVSTTGFQVRILGGFLSLVLITQLLGIDIKWYHQVKEQPAGACCKGPPRNLSA